MKTYKLVVGVLALVGLSNCALISTVAALRCPHSYEGANYIQSGRDITHYVVPSNLAKSKLGVPIGPGVDGDKVDAAFVAVSKCLGVQFHACAVHAVMIAPDAFVVPGTESQAFPCVKPGPVSSLCVGVNQQPATIVLTPDMSMMNWEAERMLRGDDPNKDGGKDCWQDHTINVKAKRIPMPGPPGEQQ